MSIRIPHLAIEITRRCNIKCSHCLRGESENKDIPLEWIDVLLSQVKSINLLCFTGGEPTLNIPAIQYTIQKIKENCISVDRFYIATNGMNITREFVNYCLTLKSLCEYENKCSVQISNDYYHSKEGDYNDLLLKELSIYSKREYRDRAKLDNWELHKEGRSTANHPKAYKKIYSPEIQSIDDLDDVPFYINVNGHIINGCDWSYENQEKHKLCKVENLEKFYNAMKTNDDFIEQDWERMFEQDYSDRLQRQLEEKEEWQRWEYEQNKKRKPAKIEIIRTYKKEEK